MTDLECKKICKLLDIKDLWLNQDGVLCVMSGKNEVGQVYIYEDNFSYALPLRMLKMPSKGHSRKKTLLKFLFKSSSEGIKSALIGLTVDTNNLCTLPSKRKLLDAYESIESLLVQYDLKFAHKKTIKKSRR